MYFFFRAIAAVLAVLPLVAAHGPDLQGNYTDDAKDSEVSCYFTPPPSLIALHERIANEDPATMEEIARGHAIMQNTLRMGEIGLQGSPAGMNVTKRDTGERITINAWFHVIYSKKRRMKGYIKKYRLDKQLRVLNNAFRSSNISFGLDGTTYTDNDLWADDPGKYEKAMKRTLHRGDARVLNLYFVPGLGVAGTCRLPSLTHLETKRGLTLDGCMLRHNTVPTSPLMVGRGKMAVHEVGHWFGLLHTFEGGCDEKGGDYVADTPAEETANKAGCWRKRDTCPELFGTDPIHNYMDYSAENEFTPGQTARMRSIFAAVRLRVPAIPA
ncbi:metalloprotease 1 [Cordyceps fumosorosea ARSEF 2679]|uniref:Metalloprotease 1 n=1 Tax=Cordyceps fumosorosea (strain ARSEF 2679) TaxID=1081104 RepID=A0A162MSQ4_CORFA|nr:metalloprotease 1 [Cordyceps fumosorosea ARSEF 2679]OAA69709.1 metalloprotease 1 [Cordyceps fumosorosea ARSEF 2679]